MLNKIFEKCLNRYLALDLETKSRMHPLQNKTVKIELQSINIIFYLHFTENKIEMLSDSLTPPDISIKGTPLNLFHLSLARDDARHQFFAEDVTILGNMELAQKVIDLFDKIEIDWEEHLSHFVGDIGAHQVGRFARGIKQFSERVKNSLTQNMNEYVHEEIDLAPTHEMLQDFFHDVDAIRMDVDRLEARIKQLRNSKEIP